jgi:hypothetical protein
MSFSAFAIATASQVRENTAPYTPPRQGKVLPESKNRWAGIIDESQIRYGLEMMRGEQI